MHNFVDAWNREKDKLFAFISICRNISLYKLDFNYQKINMGSRGHTSNSQGYIIHVAF